MLLVYDVKLSQLGRKNLAVRFNLMQHKDHIADGRRPRAGRSGRLRTRCRGTSGVSRKTESRERVFPRPAARAPCAQCPGEQFGIVAVRTFSGLMSSAGALAKAVRLGESQRPLPVQAIGVQDNSPWQRGSFMGCFQVRSRDRFPVGQNVGKRDSAVNSALGLFQKADRDRLGDRIARR